MQQSCLIHMSDRRNCVLGTCFATLGTYVCLEAPNSRTMHLKSSSGGRACVFGTSVAIVGTCSCLETPHTRNVCLKHTPDRRTFGLGIYFRYLASRDRHRCPEWQSKCLKHICPTVGHVFRVPLLPFWAPVAVSRHQMPEIRAENTTIGHVC